MGPRVKGTELPLQHGSHPETVRRISQARGRGPQETLVPFPLADRPWRQWTLRNWNVLRGCMLGKGKGCGPASQRKEISRMDNCRRNWNKDKGDGHTL